MKDVSKSKIIVFVLVALLTKIKIVWRQNCYDKAAHLPPGRIIHLSVFISDYRIITWMERKKKERNKRIRDTERARDYVPA